MNIFGQVIQVNERDPFQTDDNRTIYSKDVVISAPECHTNRYNETVLRSRFYLCTQYSESPDFSVPGQGTFVTADVSINATYAREKGIYFSRNVLVRWVDMTASGWKWQ